MNSTEAIDPDSACESCGRRGRPLRTVVFVEHNYDAFVLCVSCAAVAVSNADVTLGEVTP